MKNLLVFILILANNLANACGFYPYGEDIRISLFKPENYGYTTYSNFYYSTASFGSNGDESPKEYDLPNLKLWFNYCKGKVDIPSIDIAVYQLFEGDINEHSQNEMIQYLYRQKDNEALNYLRFAKNCSFFNSWQEDPWERATYLSMPKRTELMNRAMAMANKTVQKELKRRYSFLAIRLAWYNHHYDTIQSIFQSVFEQSNQKDILYYWSLYFKSFTKTNSAQANFDLAQVFAHAADKRFVCHQYFNAEVSIEEVLPLAKTNIEKANVYLFYGIEKPDKALSFLQKIYALNPSSDGLSFLLLREINKVEDYVLTPYYTMFEPSLSSNGDTSTRQSLNRAERDRLYAKEVLQFVLSADKQKVENPYFWLFGQTYLDFITRDYNACLLMVNQLEKSFKGMTLSSQLQIIKALAMTAQQKKGTAIIPTQIESILKDHQKNGQFIFAIGKELEYLGNTTDAALLYAQLGISWNDNNPIFWKSMNNKNRSYNDYFVDYFNYVDAVYTPEQTQHLINTILKNQNKKDTFSVFKYASIMKNLDRLYDLLGIKYIRQNKLEQALSAFGKLNEQYWTMNYSPWGNEEHQFNHNPFYRLNYTPEFITPKEKFRLNKYSITKQLIHYLHKAENPKEQDRDYYYFLVANAYYNMGFEGNIAAMRRINGWSNSSLSVIEDEPEFRQTNLAKKYYLLAKQYATTDQFKALCLRMVVHCERNRMIYNDIADGYYQSEDGNSFFTNNPYYKELKEKHKIYFDDLISNCDKFETFFQARR